MRYHVTSNFNRFCCWFYRLIKKHVTLCAMEIIKRNRSERNFYTRITRITEILMLNLKEKWPAVHSLPIQPIKKLEIFYLVDKFSHLKCEFCWELGFSKNWIKLFSKDKWSIWTSSWIWWLTICPNGTFITLLILWEGAIERFFVFIHLLQL